MLKLPADVQPNNATVGGVTCENGAVVTPSATVSSAASTASASASTSVSASASA